MLTNSDIKFIKTFAAVKSIQNFMDAAALQTPGDDNADDFYGDDNEDSPTVDDSAYRELIKVREVDENSEEFKKFLDAHCGNRAAARYWCRKHSCMWDNPYTIEEPKKPKTKMIKLEEISQEDGRDD